MSRKVFWALYLDFVAILPLEILRMLILKKKKKTTLQQQQQLPREGGRGRLGGRFCYLESFFVLLTEEVKWQKYHLRFVFNSFNMT